MLSKIPSMPPRAELIMRRVCSVHGVSLAEIVGPRVTKTVVVARRECAYRLRNEMTIAGDRPSLPQIGRWMNKDHSSIFYALKRYNGPPVDPEVTRNVRAVSPEVQEMVLSQWRAMTPQASSAY